MKVVFRIAPDDGAVIALFCDSAIDCRTGFVLSYMHSGQHGEACKRLGRHWRLATETEYASLLRELRRIYAPEPIIPVNRLKA